LSTRTTSGEESGVEDVESVPASPPPPPAENALPQAAETTRNNDSHGARCLIGTRIPRESPRQGKQQTVVGLVGATLPVAVGVLGAQVPSVAVTVRRKSAGLPTPAHETGVSYSIAPPVQEPSRDE
jgi:hypothetical protein